MFGTQNFLMMRAQVWVMTPATSMKCMNAFQGLSSLLHRPQRA